MTCVLCRRTVHAADSAATRSYGRGLEKIVDSGFLTVLVITRGSSEIVNARFK